MAMGGTVSSGNEGIPSIEQIAKLYPSPEALAGFLQHEFSFKDDLSLFHQADYWQDPDEFLTRRQGDCEDYALLAEAVLAQLGKRAFVFSVYGAAYAHTVCVFIEDGAYRVINQDRLMPWKAHTLKEIASRLCPDWDWAAVAKRIGHRGYATHFLENERERTSPLSTAS
jgi:hypothetical protein